MDMLAPFLDVLYPRMCAACSGGLKEADRGLCWDCLAGLQIIQEPLCRCCGEPVEGRVDGGFLCHACTDRRPAFAWARSAARYDGPLRAAILEFKYRAGTWLLADLLRLLMACADAHAGVEPYEEVTWVPLHPTRYRSRGFNQAGLLAKGFCRLLGRDPPRPVLRRVRLTETQTHLTAAQRLTNVHGAFQVPRPGRVAGRRWLLIDDVMTTGATVGACAASLQQSGAESIAVLTVARGVM